MWILSQRHEEVTRLQRLAYYRQYAPFAQLAAPERDEQGRLRQEVALLEGDSGTARLAIHGPLDMWWGFDPGAIIQRLDQIENLQRIETTLGTPGGYVELVQVLYSDFRRRAREGVAISMEGQGLVGSAGLNLFMAGDERSIPSDTLLMTHPMEGLLVLQGRDDEIEQEAASVLVGMREFKQMNFRMFQERSGQPAETVRQWVLDPGEVWFNDQSAYENGLTTQEPENLEQSVEPPAVQQQANRLWDYALSLTQ